MHSRTYVRVCVRVDTKNSGSGSGNKTRNNNRSSNTNGVCFSASRIHPRFSSPLYCCRPSSSSPTATGHGPGQPYGRAAAEAACDVVRSCALSPECRTVMSQSGFFVDAVAQIRCGGA